MRLANEGAEPFRYSLAVDEAWLSATPTEGTLQAGSTTEIEIHALAGGTQPDTYTADLTVFSSASGSRSLEPVVTVPVTLVVVPRDNAGGDDSSVATPVIESAQNSASRTPGAAPGSGLYIFGSNLASGDSGAVPVHEGPGSQPTVLQGTSVTIIDSTNNVHLTGLTRVWPSTVSLVVPESVSLGSARLTVWQGTEASEPFPIEIGHVAPGLFSANLNGMGPGWGNVVRLGASGEESTQWVSAIDAPLGSRTAIPISLGAEADKVYLGLWSTGMRAWTQAVEATVGGLAVEVDIVAMSGSGFDWVVLGPLPRSLAGRGDVAITLTVDGRQSNSVTAFIE